MNKTFKEYFDENFKVKDGEVVHIRKGCFNGNGLCENICIGNLEDLWNEAAGYIGSKKDKDESSQS